MGERGGGVSGLVRAGSRGGAVREEGASERDCRGGRVMCVSTCCNVAPSMRKRLCTSMHAVPSCDKP